MVSIGLSEPKAVLVLHSVSLMGGAAALGMLYGVPWLSRPLAVIAFLVAAMLAWYLLRIRTYPPGSSLTDSLNRTTLPMLGQHKYRRRIGEVIFDAIAIGLGLWLAYNLRFESEAALPHRSTALFAAMPVVVACHLVAYFVCGVYRGIWRYTSAVDVPRFVGAVVLGGLLARLALGMLDLYHFGSSSLLAINGLVQFGLLGGSRGFFRLMHEMFRGASAEARNTLLVGTGELAEVWLRRLLFDPDRAVRPVGLVTALPEQVGLRVHGLPVVGTRESLAGMLSTLHVEEVLRIDPTYSEEDWQAIVALCDAHGVRTRELHVEL